MIIKGKMITPGLGGPQLSSGVKTLPKRMSQTLRATIKTVTASDPLHSKLEIHNSVLYRPNERTEGCEPYLVDPNQVRIR